jgi:hypothetical protein
MKNKLERILELKKKKQQNYKSNINCYFISKSQPEILNNSTQKQVRALSIDNKITNHYEEDLFMFSEKSFLQKRPIFDNTTNNTLLDLNFSGESSDLLKESEKVKNLQFVDDFCFNSKKIETFSYKEVSDRSINVSHSMEVLELLKLTSKASENRNLKPSINSFCLDPRKPAKLNIKSLSNLNKPKQENLTSKKFLMEELNDAFKFIEDHVYLGLSEAKEAFEKLTKKSKTFVKNYLFHILYQFPTNLKFLTIPLKEKNKKRNEEINKTVYKLAIKKFRKQFNLLQKNNCTKTNNPNLKSILENKKLGFWVWMFMETISTERENIDFVLDTCLEKYSLKNKQLFPREKGWRQNKSFKAMKNISGTFRLLVKSDHSCRKKFLDFFESREEGGFVKEYEKQIKKKIKVILVNFQKELNDCGNDFDIFLSETSKIMTDKSFKSPLILHDMESYITRCVNELNYEYSELKKIGKYYRNLKTEYQKMKDLHYSQH